MGAKPCCVHGDAYKDDDENSARKQRGPDTHEKGSVIDAQPCPGSQQKAGYRVSTSECFASESMGGGAIDLVVNNKTSGALTLCWVDWEGRLKHFYKVWNKGAIRDGSVSHKHRENTHPGHAFVAFRHTSGETGRPADRKALGGSNIEFVSYRALPWDDRDGKLCRHTLRIFEDKGRLRAEAMQEIISAEMINLSNLKYKTFQVEGWTVNSEPGLEDHEELMKTLAVDLKAVNRSLPEAAKKRLSTVCAFWINRKMHYGLKSNPTLGRGMCFHPSKQWLLQHRMMPEKAGGVEMYSFTDYLQSRDDWAPGGVLLHELSHAYHFKVCQDGFDNKSVLSAYNNAISKKLYDRVAVHGSQGLNGPIRGYAATNHKEYFAELSVALHGIDSTVELNKWYPFNRSQLEMHDPIGYKTLRDAWKLDSS